MSVMICHRVVVGPQASDTAGTHRTRDGCSRTPLTRQNGPAPSASRPSTSPTGPASRRRTTRLTPSSASSSRTAERSWRTGRTPRTAPAASPLSTAPYAPRRGLTRTGPDGDVSMGLAGSWAAGAVLVDGDEPARFDQVTTGRAAIFTGGRPVRLPDHRDGWRWEPYAVDGSDVEAARQQLQRLMRDAEADIAEALSNEGWLTVLDGPLHGIRHRRGLPSSAT